MKALEQFPDHTRIWIYQSNRLLTEQENQTVQNALNDFVVSWTSHSQQLNAFGSVLENLFIVFGVDEKSAGASGCSIDKSVKFVQQVEQSLSIELFNRMVFAYEDNGQATPISNEAFKMAFQNGAINENSLVYNNLINTLAELKSSWKIALKDSWHKRFV